MLTPVDEPNHLHALASGAETVVLVSGREASALLPPINKIGQRYIEFLIA